MNPFERIQVLFTESEMEVLTKLSEEMEMSESSVLRQALRFYELCKGRGYLEEILAREMLL